MDAAEARGDKDEADRLAHDKLKAMATAVRALRQLHHEDIRRQLEEFHKSLESATPTSPLSLSKDMLSSFET